MSTGDGWTVPVTNNGEGMNMAKWVGIWEEWMNRMLAAGFQIDDLPKIAEQHGEKFPKSLIATATSKNTLFPSANMLFEYDLDNHMKRSYPHNSNEGEKGPGEWEPMSAEEVKSAADYYAWRENPKNYDWIDNKFGGNAYNAYLSAGNGYKLQGLNGGQGAKPTGTGTTTGAGGLGGGAGDPSSVYAELARNMRTDTASQQFQLERAAREYQEGRPIQNYLTDLYGQVMGVGFDRPAFSLGSYADQLNPGTPTGGGTFDPKTGQYLPPGSAVPTPVTNIPGYTSPAVPSPKGPGVPPGGIPPTDVVKNPPYTPKIPINPTAPHINPGAVEPHGAQDCGEGSYWVPDGVTWNDGKTRGGCYIYEKGGKIPPNAVPGTGPKGTSTNATSYSTGGPTEVSQGVLPRNRGMMSTEGGGVTSTAEGDNGIKEDTSVTTGPGAVNPQITSPAQAGPGKPWWDPLQPATPQKPGVLIWPDGHTTVAATYPGLDGGGALGTVPFTDNAYHTLGGDFNPNDYYANDFMQNALNQYMGQGQTNGVYKFQAPPSHTQANMTPGGATAQGASGSADVSTIDQRQGPGTSGDRWGRDRMPMQGPPGGGPGGRLTRMGGFPRERMPDSRGPYAPPEQNTPQDYSQIPPEYRIPGKNYEIDSLGPKQIGDDGMGGPGGLQSFGGSDYRNRGGIMTADDGSGGPGGPGSLGIYGTGGKPGYGGNGQFGNPGDPNYVPPPGTNRLPPNPQFTGDTGSFENDNVAAASTANPTGNPSNPQSSNVPSRQNTTWSLLAAPASDLASNLDAQRKQIMRTMPPGGERNLALQQAMNSNYAQVGGLRQNLMNQSLTNLGSISQSKLWGQPMAPSNAAGNLLNAYTTQQGNNQQYSLGQQQIAAGNAQNKQNMWGGILSSVAGALAQKYLSDIRTKDDVKGFTRGLSDIMKLSPYEYEYNGKGGSVKGERGISVMAQDLEKVIPEAVVDGDEYKQILPMGILMTAVNAIKELETRLPKPVEKRTPCPCKEKKG